MGQVTFVENGAPAVNARVTASNSYPYNVQLETRTDSSGRYAFENLLGGEYFVAVYRPDSNEIGATRLILLGGLNNTLDLQISANRCAWFNGFVRDGVTQRGIAGVMMSFFGKAATTNSDGSFSILLGCPPVPTANPYPMIVEHPNYQRREFLLSVRTYTTTNEIIMMPR